MQKEFFYKKIPNFAFIAFVLGIVGTASYSINEVMSAQSAPITSYSFAMPNEESSLSQAVAPFNVSLTGFFQGPYLKVELKTNNFVSDSAICELADVGNGKKKSTKIDLQKTNPNTYNAQKHRKELVSSHVEIDCKVIKNSNEILINVTIEKKEGSTIVPLPGPLS